MFKRIARLVLLGWIVAGLCASSAPYPATAAIPPELRAQDDGIVFTGTKVLGDPDGVDVAVIPGGGRPGIYIGRDYDNLDPGFWPLLGGYQTFAWKDLEPTAGVYNWGPIDSFLTAVSSKGKAAGIHIVTYNGPRGGVGIPDWLRTAYPDLVFNMTPKLVPTVNETWRPSKPTSCLSQPTIEGIKYWDSRYLNAYRNLINALGARYKNDSRVEFIMAGTGLYGETQPVSDCYDYVVLDMGLFITTWNTHVQQVAQAYATAFAGAGGPPNLLKSVMIMAAPTYMHTCTRTENMDAAGPLGVGNMLAGVLSDEDNAVVTAGSLYGCGRLDPLIKWQPTAPAGQEAYWYMTPHDILAYWGVLEALSHYLDYIMVDYSPSDWAGWMYADGSGNPRPVVLSYFQWAQNYLGKSPATTPSVWVAMRDSGYTYYPQKGNYSFYLTQDDSIGGGQTKLLTYRNGIDPSDASQTAVLSYLVPKGYTAYNTNIQINVNLGGAWGGKESWIVRRTDGSSNPYMWFKIDDGFLFGGSNTVTIKVTYFDNGTDTWKIDYDGVGGTMKSTANVIKTNSRTWKTHTFVIADARMGNGLLGSSDFRINSNNDGDEYIHFVDVSKGGGGTINYDIALRQGWNFVSVPLTLASTNTETVLLPISGKYNKVYAYNAFDTADPWKVYDLSLPPFLNDLSEINNTKGLWLYATQNATWTVNGTWPGSTSIPLKTGWNLVGYPGQTIKSVSDALSSIAGKYTKVYTYLAFDDADPWKVYDVSLPVFLNDLTQIQAGRAYWIYVTQDCTLTVTN